MRVELSQFQPVLALRSSASSINFKKISNIQRDMLNGPKYYRHIYYDLLSLPNCKLCLVEATPLTWAYVFLPWLVTPSMHLCPSSYASVSAHAHAHASMCAAVRRRNCGKSCCAKQREWHSISADGARERGGENAPPAHKSCRHFRARGRDVRLTTLPSGNGWM